jgi:NADPH:quinone reductase-like Zn-dependent oxidoreductase
MKAIVLTGYGDVSNLQLRELPEPSPGAGELKVRVAASSINVIDLKLRSGSMQRFIPIALPHVLGRDTSGEVVELGSGVSSFKVGDRVLGFVQSAYAEYVAAPAEAWAPVPARLALEDAAALPVVVLTGAQLVEEAVRAQRGDVVLVTGAAGSVGRVAVYVAKQLGARVIAGVRKSQAQLAESLGAETVVALDDPAALERIPPLDAIADTVGGETVARLLPRVKRDGAVGSVLGDVPAAKERGLVVRAIVTHADSKRLAQLAEAVAAGELIIPIGGRFPMSDAGQAHQAAERGAGGKILITMKS